MPRAKKTMSGETAQPVRAITGQTYGQGVQQEALQRMMPAPSAPTVSAPRVEAPSPNRAPRPEQQQTETPRRPTLEEALSSISGRGGLLSEPDANPDVPVTSGLPVGPGRGPEMMASGNPLGNTLRRLARETGDNIFIELASRARI
jgi:hypothetical protein